MSSHTAKNKMDTKRTHENAPEPLRSWSSDALKVVGHAHPRASAWAKVTGQAEFSSDVALPNMAHAVLVRATIPCGTVISFDGADALTIPGVLAVFGPFDFISPTLPRRTRPVIDTAVSFVGEEIGVVVAETEATARHAARMVRVDYERASACVTIEQALVDAAPLLTQDGNVVCTEVVERGNLDSAQVSADVFVDAHYTTEAQHHNCMEPHGCVADWEISDGASKITLWDSNQGGHMIRERLAVVLALPLDQVRVISRYVGGGFGSKIHIKPYHVIAAELARHIGRPVRLFMARREEFIASHQRAPTRRHIKLGATHDGKLLFIDESIVGQAGPYGDLLAQNAAGATNGLRLHRADAVRAEVRRVLTNTQIPLPFRGPTVAEDIFCLEQAIDELAHALRMDPLAFRQRNLADIDILAGLPYAGKELERCYTLGAQAFGWKYRSPTTTQTQGKARGIGMGAVCYDGTLYEPSKTEVACLPNGGIEVRIGITEIGCGADTVFAQIAAEALGLPLNLLQTHFGDTDSTPRSLDATNHSRTTAVVGPSVRAAAHQLKLALLQAGAAMLRIDPADAVLDERGVSLRDGSVRTSLANIVASTGTLVRAADRERPPPGVFAAMFGAHFVEVEVDLHSGHVSVLRAICAHDAGRIVNPRLATSQVQGGFLQGMGMAMQEQRILDARNGHMLNATMWAYKTPSIVDAPNSILFVDASKPDGGNSIGVKGIGEPPLIASGAAIANAIYNAIGIRMRSYPITPEKILAALKGHIR